MIKFLLRLLWRVLIFVLGGIALQLAVIVFWPESESRLSVFFALFIIYCLMAYIVIPALVRLFHVFMRPDHIPVYVTTGDGWPSDPVNLAVIAKSREHLIETMKKAGWYESDPLTIRNGVREAISILFNTPYPEAPLSQLYLFDRPQDVAFAIPTTKNGSARTRHHVRFWRLQKPHTESRNHKSHYEFWRDKLRHILHLERDIWIGAATEDIRFVDIQWRTGRLTHGVSHEADKERDFVIKTLQNIGSIKDMQTTAPGEQIKFRGQSFRTMYTTDGSIKIIRLK